MPLRCSSLLLRPTTIRLKFLLLLFAFHIHHSLLDPSRCLSIPSRLSHPMIFLWDTPPCHFDLHICFWGFPPSWFWGLPAFAGLLPAYLPLRSSTMSMRPYYLRPSTIFLARLFLKKKSRYCHSPVVRRLSVRRLSVRPSSVRRDKTLTFSNISAISKDIFFKLGIVVYSDKAH